MGILGILRDSAGSLGDSRGFSGFLEKVYEVSEVSSPSHLYISSCYFCKNKDHDNSLNFPLPVCRDQPRAGKFDHAGR